MATTVVVVLLTGGFVIAINLVSVVLARKFFPGNLKRSVSVFKLLSPSKFKGSALRGTAQILSLEPTGPIINGLYVCDIGLRVEIPGRQPYDVTVSQPIHPISMPALHPGSTLQVQVDSAEPLKVRIDSSEPMGTAPMGSPSSPPSLAQLADAYNEIKQCDGSAPGQWASAADLLASGQRVPGVLKSFVATGDTARGLGKTTSRPELLDAPRYLLEVELHFPNLAPVIGRNSQAVPVAQVPNLAIGREFTCAVDPADPSNRFVVDWDSATELIR